MRENTNNVLRENSDGNGYCTAQKVPDKESRLPKSRLYVHLSKDVETATKVGSRHGRPIVYEVASGKMRRDGIRFFLSANGVWLTKNVPPDYLRRI